MGRLAGFTDDAGEEVVAQRGEDRVRRLPADLARNRSNATPRWLAWLRMNVRLVLRWGGGV